MEGDALQSENGLNASKESGWRTQDMFSNQGGGGKKIKDTYPNFFLSRTRGELTNQNGVGNRQKGNL